MSTWHKIVVEGTQKTLRAFMAGFTTGSGTMGHALLGDDLDLERHSLAEKVLELFDSGTHHLVFAHADVATRIIEAIDATSDQTELHVHSRFEVTAGRFSFEAEAFAQDVAARIKDELLRSLPEGVRLSDLDEDEEHHPEARGPELYAPAHSYIYRAKATVAGPFPTVMDVYQRARALDFVRAGSVTVEAIELPLHR